MSRKIKNTEKLTALYCRLSLEDGRDNESMSISNQKAMLKDYAEKNGMTRYAFYIDDGYTGRNFNRPGFQSMIADIEAGKINCVITKDLSRLGRNYIEAGSYIEIYFPQHSVRYIAIADNVDSLNSREIDITPFKNILNDMYSRDISKKVLAARMVLSRQGKYCGGGTPYGLIRDPKDKGHLIQDPKTAPTVKLIFDLALDGNGTMRIAKHLMDKKIPITRTRTNKNPNVNSYSWGSSIISKILRNPTYYGAHVVCKTHQKAIRSNTYNFIPRDEWEIIENCHEPIVTKEQWLRVQELINRRPPIMQGNNCPYKNIFHGLVYCETCNKSMQARYEKKGRTDINRTTKEKREPIDKAFYTCQTYNRLGKNVCTSHKIEARDLYNLVLNDILEHSKKVITDSDSFQKQLAEKLQCSQITDRKTLEKEIEGLRNRNAEIDKMFLSLYEDKTKGIITEHRFILLTANLEKEQNENTSRINGNMQKLSRSDEQSHDIKMFINELSKYAAIEVLDEKILNRLIDKIYIGESYTEKGERIQKVKIIYNFIGEIPA